MALQDAVRFIGEVARDTELQSRIRGARPRGDLQVVVEIAAGMGFELTADELREAFARDWGMRRRFYSGIKEGEEPGPG